MIFDQKKIDLSSKIGEIIYVKLRLMSSTIFHSILFEMIKMSFNLRAQKLLTPEWFMDSLISVIDKTFNIFLCEYFLKMYESNEILRVCCLDDSRQMYTTG